jgi:hypothetical protein
MRITIKADSTCGNAVIPKGEYWVSLHNDTQQIFLSSGGKDIKLPATRRRTKAKTKSVAVTFFNGGGNQWTLQVSTPKHGEWVVFIELGKGKVEEKREHRLGR